MYEKEYEVIDRYDHVVASRMNLRTALLLIKALCEEYFGEQGFYTVRELERCVGVAKTEV